ncbi:MAG: hypothetical protein P1U56_09220 [Saprospiraceae bacterium]|nr:hypothetical protein [Saprospiraceae bacterium]
MKSKKIKLSNFDLVLPNKAIVDKLRLQWQKCLSTELNNLFSRETPNGVQRTLNYRLNPTFVPLIKKLNAYKNGNNVKTISIVLGNGTDGEDESNVNQFVPLLQVILEKSMNKQKVYYFYLEPIDLFHHLGIANNTVHSTINQNEELSPKVAQLFMLKWESLSNQDIVEAFECLAPEDYASTGSNSSETFFSPPALKRVRQYNFDVDETNRIFMELNSVSKADFVLSMGAGLTVPNYHPFSFRPIIRVIKYSNAKSLVDPSTAYFDTSRPCPPFCGQGN